MTSTTFKDRYRNHKKSFDDIKHQNDTELSKHVWKLKLNDKQFSINWSILSRANAIKAGGKICNLCLEEKLKILRCCNSNSNLNKRGKLFTKCAMRADFTPGDSNEHASANIPRIVKRTNITVIIVLPDDCLLHET